MERIQEIKKLIHKNREEEMKKLRTYNIVYKYKKEFI